MEKAMAPHSSTLAWKIPWMEEPSRLQSVGLLRVGHGWATSPWLFTLCIGEGNGNPLQCSCLENPSDGGAWWAAIYGVAQSRIWLKRLSRSSSPFKMFSVMLFVCVCLLSCLNCVWLCATQWTAVCRLLCPWNSPGENTGVIAMPSPRGSFRPRDWTHVSYIYLRRQVLDAGTIIFLSFCYNRSSINFVFRT